MEWAKIELKINGKVIMQREIHIPKSVDDKFYDSLNKDRSIAKAKKEMIDNVLKFDVKYFST